MAKIYCKKSDLNEALNNVSHSLPGRTPSVILEGVLIDVKDKGMRLSTTDGTVMIQSTIDVDSDSDISTVVQYKTFSSFVSKLPEEEVMLEIADDRMTLKSGSFQTELFCMNSDEFPDIKFEEPEGYLTIDKNIFKKMVQKTAFSASAEEINGVLTGVLIKTENNYLNFVAVDTFRLAINRTPYDGDQELEVIIPAKMLSNISRIIKEGDENRELKLAVSDNKALLLFDNNRVILTTLSGKYIDYNRILSRDTSIKVRAKREDLINSIGRASILSSFLDNNLIKFDITDDNICINSMSDQGNMSENIEVIKEGEDLEIGFNSTYMSDALKAIDDEEIMLSLTNSVSPCIITPLSGDSYLYFVLPVRIN